MSVINYGDLARTN